MKKTIFVLGILLVFLSSCNNSFFQVEKRHYRKGFYVHHSKPDSKELTTDTIAKSSTANNTEKRSESSIKPNVITVKEEMLVLEKSPNLKGKTKNRNPNLPILKSLKRNFKNIKSSHRLVKDADEKYPNDRNINIAATLGLVAIVLIIVGLIAIEVAVFGIVPLVIGIFCAMFGLRFGRTAMNSGSKKNKRKSDTNKDPGANRKRAKKAYLLNLMAILILLLYIIIRFGIVAAGAGAVGIALILLGICLILFLLFKMGVFRDLKG